MTGGTRRAALAVVACLVLAGCATQAVAAPPAPIVPPPAPTVTLDPPAGATDVAPAVPITVTATNGTLADVALTDGHGITIPGSLSQGGAVWTATAPPKFGETYQFSGMALGPSGGAPVSGGFSTVRPKRFVSASTSIGDGDEVGVGAPIIVRFSRVVAESERAAAERALHVTTSTPVTGSWAWLPDRGTGSRVHWRPQQYWPPHTTVTMTAALYGVDLGTAGYGRASLSTTFTVGRSQIVKADARTHRVQVVRDGRLVMDLAASYGADSDPRRITRSGTHIVMNKSPVVYMTNPAFGYTNIPERWAVRISDNGEFIHANPASSYAWGNRNVTHGCINLSTANAKQYYDTALYGDPVEISGTSVPLSADDGDVYDWAIPWDAWTAMSALH